MTDGPEYTGRKQDETVDATVATLASRAIAVLASKRARTRPVLSERLVLQMIAAARDPRDSVMRGAVTDLLHSGIPAVEVLDFYIPEAARRLGESWMTDRLGFADVTIATARLQRVVRFLADRPGIRATDARLSILLVVAEGEYHTLGPMIMAEQLRRKGISVRLVLGESNREVLKTVAEGHFDAIFFSISSSDKLADVKDLVEKTRKALGTPTPIVAGGPIGRLRNDGRTLTGADHFTSDPKEALRLCGLTVSPPVERPHESSE